MLQSSPLSNPPSFPFSQFSPLKENKNISDYLLNKDTDFNLSSKTWIEILNYFLLTFSFQPSSSNGVALENIKMFLISLTHFYPESSALKKISTELTLLNNLKKLNEIVSVEVNNATYITAYRDIISLLALPNTKALLNTCHELNAEFVRLTQNLENNSWSCERQFKNYYRLIYFILTKTVISGNQDNSKREINESSESSTQKESVKNSDVENPELICQGLEGCNKNFNSSNQKEKPKPVENINAWSSKNYSYIDSPSSNEINLIKYSGFDYRIRPSNFTLPKQTTSKDISSIAEEFFNSVKKRLITYSNNFFSSKNYTLISIGSNSIGLNFLTFYQDLVLLPRDQTIKNLSLTTINKWWSYDMNGHLFTSNDLTNRYIDKGVLSFVCYNTKKNEVSFNVDVHIYNSKYLSCNNMLKSIFRPFANTTKLHWFYQAILDRFKVNRRIDLSFLIWAYLDSYYDIFERETKMAKKDFHAILYRKDLDQFDVWKESGFYFKINRQSLINLTKTVDFNELIINFLDFTLRLLQTEEHMREYENFPGYFFDEEYLYNINKIYKRMKKEQEKDNMYWYEMRKWKKGLDEKKFATYQDLWNSIHWNSPSGK